MYNSIQAFGFATPQLQKRVVDALLAGSSTLFSPLPGALEASLNLSPVEGLTLDVNETEDETEELEVAVKPSKVIERLNDLLIETFPAQQHNTNT